MRMEPGMASEGTPPPAQTIAIIPTRMGSTRFPGKPLADATGRPMIQHVYERVRDVGRIDRVIVATDDARILEAAQPVITQWKASATAKGFDAEALLAEYKRLLDKWAKIRDTQGYPWERG